MENQQNSPKITFVTFYTPLSQKQLSESLKKVTDLKAKWTLLPPMFKQWMLYLKIFFLSTRRSHPNCHHVLITDMQTKLELPESVRVIRQRINQDRIMYEKLCCQINFLKNHDVNSHVIFLDNDMIVQGNLQHLFKKKFDIGFSYMLHHTGSLYALPISNAVIVVPCTQRQSAINFLEEVKEVYERDYFTSDLLKWQGGEYAMKKRIGVKNIKRSFNDIIPVDDYRVLLLDPALYNYSSEDFFEMKDYYPDKKILHFKHMRKPEMPIYWDLYQT